MKRLLLVAGVALMLLGGLVGTAYANTQGASGFAPYRIPPHVPPAKNHTVRSLLKGSKVTAHDNWIIVHLKGGPYQIGFQNGYLTAQSSDYTIQTTYGAPGSKSRVGSDKVARKYIWPLVPVQY